MNYITGGMLHSVISLVNHLKKDFNVVVIANEEAEIFKKIEEIEKIKLENRFIVDFKMPIATLKTYLEIRKKIQVYNSIDSLVITNNVGSELLFSGFGIRPINIKRIFVSRGGNYRGKTGFVLKQGFKSIIKFVAISNHQKNILISNGIPAEKIVVIHNGVEKIKIDKKNTFDKKLVKISIVGYIDSKKNQLLALNSLNFIKHSNVQINIYGIAFTKSNKQYKKKLDEFIEKEGLSKMVNYKGYEANKNLIYKETDILLSTSLAEGFGRTVAEAMSIGIPCIGLKESGGLYDVITHFKDVIAATYGWFLD